MSDRVVEHSYFQNPRRFPKNAEGPFYTTGCLSPETDAPDSPMTWCGDCLWCEAPEAEAPELLAPLDEGNSDTYFVRQPANPKEVADACDALSVCCVVALRYGGRDRSIIQRLGNNPELCDYIVDVNGEMVRTLSTGGELLPFARRIVRKQHARWQREDRKRSKRWWQIWK